MDAIAHRRSPIAMVLIRLFVARRVPVDTKGSECKVRIKKIIRLRLAFQAWREMESVRFPFVLLDRGGP